MVILQMDKDKWDSISLELKCAFDLFEKASDNEEFNLIS